MDGLVAGPERRQARDSAGLIADTAAHGACDRLRDAMRRDNPTKRPRRAAPFRIRRPERKAAFRFECDDPHRQEAIPRNFETKPEELRPKSRCGPRRGRAGTA